jgi:hypothetical protein
MATTPGTATRAGNVPAPVINPFQCYEIKPKPFAPIPGVQVIDRFGAHVARVRFPHRLCAPGVLAPRAAVVEEHLIGHLMSSPNLHVTNQTVVNQFGTLQLDVSRPDLLLVPTQKSLFQTPPPLPNPTVDHFQCYRVRRSRGAAGFVPVKNIVVTDQFGTATVDLVRVARLCVPANKNDEDPTAPSHPTDLLCYRTRNSRFGTVQTYTNSQFGPEEPLLIHRRELCVPSTRTPPTTTTTTSTSTTIETSTTFPSSTTFPPDTTTTTTTMVPTSTTFPPIP